VRPGFCGDAGTTYAGVAGFPPWGLGEGAPVTQMTGQAGRLRRFNEKFIVEERVVPASAKHMLVVVAIALMAVGLAAFVTILDSVLDRDGLSAIDAPVEQWLETGRTEWMTIVMIVIAIAFGPIVMPIIIVVATVTWAVTAKHAWRPLLLAGGMLLGVLIVQALAPVIARERPPISDMLFGVDHTSSFPSGHVMGVADFLLITTYLIFSRHRRPVTMVLAFVAASGIVLLTAACRIYLGYHWATDALGSLALSLIVLGIVIAVDTWRTVRVGSPAEVAASEARREE
jgi:membrane-associated phospholipid phosphatase